MSFIEITRSCFQSGIPAPKWLSLCKQYAEENTIIDPIHSGISNSVLFLYQSYQGDPSLNSYLIHALKDGVLPLPIYVSTFLSAARSPDLHSGAALDFLCELALKEHEQSGQIPLGSLVLASASPMSKLEIVQDALALVRVSHNMSLNVHHHKLVANSEWLLYHLLSCVNDISQMTVGQAFVTFSTVSDILRDMQLNPQVRGLLNGFAASLGMHIGSDAKVAREAQMIQGMQIAKSNIGGLNSENDIISIGLLWQYLVTHRGHEFGAGHTQAVVSLLVSLWRWSSWSAQVFYTQVFVAAFTCVASCPTLGDPNLWKAFTVGRIPRYLVAFQEFVGADPSLGIDSRAALRQGLKLALRRQDLLASSSNNHMIGQAPFTETSYAQKLLHQMLTLGLIESNFAQEVDHMAAQGSGLKYDHRDTNADSIGDFDSWLAPHGNLSAMTKWAEHVWNAPGSHCAFAATVLKKFEASCYGVDAEPLSSLCRLLYTKPSALDLVALHLKISDLIFYALSFLEEYDCETVGDPQTTLSHLGDVVLFVQYTLIRFQVDQDTFEKDNKKLSAAYLRHTDEVLKVEGSRGPDTLAFHAWFKALFDSSSEGIEDSILRSTHPKLLLRIVATLFSQAIKAADGQKIDPETLSNGVSYFTGPLLNWTLVGVIKSLVNELQLAKNPLPVTFDVLQTLITSPSCPKPVLALCSPVVLRFIADRRNDNIAKYPSFDVATVEDLVRRASNRVGNAEMSFRINYWDNYPKNQIRTVITMARSSKIVLLDVDRCLKLFNPTRFVQALWSELTAAATLGEYELCRRVATFVLTMPRNSQVPPLLPIFMHLFLPSLLQAMDKKGTPDSAAIELTSSIIMSTLTAAFHLEWSMTTVLGDNRMVLGASSSSMAKRVASDLRSRKNGLASQDILQRLAASQSFVANFPYFASDVVN